MPRYQVTLDGKTFVVEGSRPPTEDEARSALGEFQASKPKAVLPTRPVAAEDFLPEQKSGLENALDVAKGVGRSVAGAVTGAGKLALDAQKMLMLGNPDAFKEDLRGILGAQGEQLSKAATRAGEGRISEAIGHGAAGLLPLAGPAAAAVGEKAETDPFGALGETAGMVGLPAIARGAPRAAAAAGRGAAAVGRGARVVGREAAPSAGTAIGAAVGGPVGAILGGQLGEGVKRLLGRKIEPTAAATSVNTGGRVVKPAASSLDSDMAAMLAEVSDELATRPPPARITTPPEPNLPAGFTPRTTIPKPKPAKASLPAEKAAAAEPSPPKRAYFLRPKAETAAASEPVAPLGRSVGIEDIPASMRPFVGTRLTEPAGVGLPPEVLSKLSGGSATADALEAVSKNPTLTNETRLHLRNALLAMLQ